MIKIYCLSDPIIGEIRYIGKTSQTLQQRLSKHLSRFSLVPATHKNNWIKELLFKGLKPTIELLDCVPTDDWEFWEQWYIAYFKGFGIRLTNGTNGGECGPSNKINDGLSASQRYRNRHIDECKERDKVAARMYRKDNRDKIKLSKQKYYNMNKNSILNKNKIYDANNADKRRLYSKRCLLKKREISNLLVKNDYI